MERLIAVKVSPRAGAFSVHLVVEKALVSLLSSRSSYTMANGEECALIYLIQALPYFTHINRDPWGKAYPTVQQVIDSIHEHTPVEVSVGEPDM